MSTDTLPRGLVEVPFAEYLAHNAVSSHVLQAAALSAEHYQFARNGGNDKSTPAMRIGRAVHCKTLTPELMSKDFAIVDSKTRTTKAYKEAEAQHWPTRECLLRHESELVDEVWHAISRNPLAMKLTRSATWKEKSIFWERDGIKCKARIDALYEYEPGRVMVCDLKTARSASHMRGPGGERPFQAACLDMGYHRQIAWYMRALHEGTDLKPRHAILIVVEKEAPFLVRVYELGDQWLSVAYRELDDLWKVARACESGEPLPEEQVRTLPLPSWAKRTQ